MGVGAYNSGSSKRIFTNYPFKKGMRHQELTSSENECRTLANYDYTNSGDRVFPRPAFVNAMLHNGYTTTLLPESTILQTTNLGPKFLISSRTWVSEEDFKNDTVHTYPYETVNDTYDITVTKVLDDITNYETVYGVKDVAFSAYQDGDTIKVYDKDKTEDDAYFIRLLGINTPDSGEDYYQAATDKMTDILTQYGTDNLQIVYDPASRELGEYDRPLVYLFANGHFVNGIMLAQGLAVIDFLNTNYLLYDVLQAAYEAAVDGQFNLYGGQPEPSISTSDLVLFFAFQEDDFDLEALSDPEKILFFKRSVWENQTIDSVIYDSVGFTNDDELTATDLFTISAGDTYIQMLRNDYTKTEYEHTVTDFEYPHANHAWRNAISFIGRIIISGEVAYKGLITLQYDGTDHKMIVIKAAEIEPMSWNTSDISSLQFNALDDDPYIYEDHISDDIAAYFTYPSISTALIYNKKPVAGGDAKVLSSFNRTQNCYIKPYVVLPDLDPTDLKGVYLKYNFDPKDDSNEGFTKITHILDSTIFLNNSVLYTTNRSSLSVDGNWGWLLNSISGTPVGSDSGILIHDEDEAFNTLTGVKPAINYQGEQWYCTDYEGMYYNFTSMNGMLWSPYSQIHKDATLGSYIFLLGQDNPAENGLYQIDDANDYDFALYSAAEVDGKRAITADLQSYVYNGTEWVETYYALGVDVVYEKNFIDKYNTENEYKDFSKLGGQPLNITLRTRYLHTTEDDITFDRESLTTEGIKSSITIANINNVIPPADLDEDLVYHVGYTYISEETEFDFEITNLRTQTSTYQTETVATEGTRSIVFEGFKFSINFSNTVDSVRDKITVTFNTNTYDSNYNTQIIYFSGTRFVDPNDMLKTHNIWNATHVTQWDRYLILYGEGMGNHSLQFLEYDNFSLAPFPYGQIIFDGEIIHVHVHRNNLYVFCDDGVWILHDGLTYDQLQKTFAYGGIVLDPAEKGTVASLGNNVIVLHNNKGFMIRTNINIDSPTDVYTVPFTAGVDSIIGSPALFLKDQFQLGYGILIDDLNDLTVFYKTFVDNNEVHLTASYYLGNPLNKMMITYIYNNDTGRWKLYHTVAAGFPLATMPSKNAKGFDYLCVNDFTEGLPTLATYLHTIPENTLFDYEIADSIAFIKDDEGVWKPATIENGVENPFIPIACVFDTGSLDLNSMHKKRFRNFKLNFLNILGQSMEFLVIPYADGLEAESVAELEAIITEYGTLQRTIDLDSEIIIPEQFTMITPAITEIDGYTIPESYFTTKRRLLLNAHINLLCKIPGVKTIVYAKARFEVTHYALVYRQMSAR